MGGENQVLNWLSELLTEEGVLHPYNLWLVLQSFLQGQESADKLPDRDPGLESAECGPELGIPAVEPPKQALLGPGQDHLLRCRLLFSLIQRLFLILLV